MKKVYKLGVIGCGDLCNEAYIPAFVEIDRVLVIGLYDIDRKQAERTLIHLKQLSQERIAFEKVQNVPLYHGWTEQGSLDRIESSQHQCEAVTIYDDFMDLIQNVDIVCVTTPVRYHAYYAKKCLELGKPVMSEKAMARHWVEAKYLNDFVKQCKVLYQLNDDNVYLPRYRLMKNLVESGTIGDVTHVRITRGSRGPERRAWYWDPEMSGGGCWMDYGTHAVTSSWFLIGFDKIPVGIRAVRMGTTQPTRIIAGGLREITVEDDAHVEVFYEDPKQKRLTSVLIEATWSTSEFGPRSEDYAGLVEIWGTEGRIWALMEEEGKDAIHVIRDRFGEWVLPVPPTVSEKDSFMAQVNNFVNCLDEGRTPMLNAEIGETVTAILTAGYYSLSHDRRTVTLDEVRHEFGKYKNDEESIIQAINETVKTAAV